MRSTLFITRITVCLITISSASAFSSCKSKKNASSGSNTETMQQEKVSYNDITAGILYGAGEEGLENGIYIANNESEARQLFNQFNSINATVDMNLLQTVDFEKNSMVVICDAVRGSGGHSFAIKQIKKDDHNIYIYTESKAPEGPASMVITQPFIIIEMESSNLPILLR
jgi:hypothetical protein